MTIRKPKAPAPAETVHYERIRQSSDSGSDTPSFSTVWKWFMGGMSLALGAGMIGAFTWMWNMQNSMTTLTGSVASNTDSIKALVASDVSISSRMDRQGDTLAQHAVTMAAVQVQLTNAQSNASAAAITLANRMDRWEQEARWRERLGTQQPVRR